MTRFIQMFSKLFMSKCNSISRPGGTAGWLWNLRSESRALPLNSEPPSRRQSTQHARPAPIHNQTTGPCAPKRSRSNPCNQARRPNHSTSDTLPDHAGLPVTHCTRAAGRSHAKGPGTAGLAQPGGTLRCQRGSC
jgi:hypothetical protein